MSGRWWRIGAELLIVLAVAIVATSVFARAPAKQAGDEANWLGTARYFLVLFVRHDIAAEAWPDSYWTRTQPMVPRYIMGGWLWARGVEYEWLDPNFDHTKKWFTNEREGKAPTEAILSEARAPMRALSVVAAGLLYGVVRVMAGPIGGVAAALLFCGSSYVPLHMVRAMGEPPFIVFLLATLLMSLVAIKRGGRRPGVGLGILTGVLLGLAFASKLTAIIAFVVVLLWGAWAAVGNVVARRLSLSRNGPEPAPEQPTTEASGGPVGPASTPRAIGSAWMDWSLGVIAVALLTFVATNPFLYHDPIGRSWLLFANRQAEMTAQAEIDPERAVTSLQDRAKHVWKYSLVEDTWAHTRLRWPLEAALAVVGLAWLILRAVRFRPGAEAFLLLWVLGFFGGVTIGLGYVLDHYFMPTATMGLILGGLAVGWSAQLVWQAGRHLLGRWRHSAAPRETGEVVTA